MHINKDGQFEQAEEDIKFFSKLACRLPFMLGGGHKRGRRVGADDHEAHAAAAAGKVLFACPRCGERWSRKVKA